MISGHVLPERAPASASLVDVLERVLDKGIVIDAWLRVSIFGIYVVMVEARVLVASIETYMRHAESVVPASATMAQRLGAPAALGAPDRP